MKKLTEQELARHMLAHRSKRYSIGSVLRESAMRYVIHVAILALFVIWFRATNQPCYKGLCLWGIGMFMGALARDAGWLRRIKNQWIFTEKIINWQIVEDIAAGKTCANNASSATAPERVLFDTDPGGDIDDAGAMAILHALADRGEIELLAIGVSNGHPLTVPYTRAVNAWFGRPGIPVGNVPAPGPYSRDEYMEAVIGKGTHDAEGESAPDAAMLYRRILAEQPDCSVTLVVVGPCTNIAKLLESGPDEQSPLTGVELVRRKVKFYAAGGNGGGKLPSGPAGFNYQKDSAAARTELAKMPVEVPMVFAGGSGNALLLGNCYRDTPPDHIVRRSYEAYFAGKDSLDRPTWDQLRVLYACRPASRALFETSPFGDITLDENRQIAWHDAPNRNKAYAYVKDFDAVRAQLTDLMTHLGAQ